MEAKEKIYKKTLKSSLHFKGFRYHRTEAVYYRCVKFRSKQCMATLQVEGNEYRTNNKKHNHPSDSKEEDPLAFDEANESLSWSPAPATYKDEEKTTAAELPEKVTLQHVMKRSAGNKYKFKLPVETIEDLDSLEKLLKDCDDREVFITFLREIKGISTLSEIFVNLVTDTLIAEFNWDGKKGQKKLKAYRRVFGSIFEKLPTITTAVSEGGLYFMGFKYHKSGAVKNGVVYYRCAKFRSKRCPASLQVEGDSYRTNDKEHNHSPKSKEDALVGKKLCYDGFYFYRHGKCESKLYWRCARQGCSVRLHTNFYGHFISIRGEHKHSK